MKANLVSRRGSRNWLGVCCALFLGLAAMAQETNQFRSAEELESMLAPVALYPDALIAVMLPAATAPADVVLAARYLASGGATNQLDAQAWDDSVRTLAHYPELTQWMNDNLEWTRAVGEAFRIQPADVMAAVQRLRAKAQAVGNLTSTPQQKVITTQNIITIVPAEPEIIYVPHYDPMLVYATPAPWGCSWISFGLCWQFGMWPRYDFDWRHCSVRRHEHHPHERYPFTTVRPWHPSPVVARPSGSRPACVPRPQPLTIAAQPAAPVPAAIAPAQAKIQPVPPPHHHPAQAPRTETSTGFQLIRPHREPTRGEERKESPRDSTWHSGIVRTPPPSPPTIFPRNAPPKPPEPRIVFPQLSAPAKPISTPPVQVRVQPPQIIMPNQKIIARQEVRAHPAPAISVRDNKPATPQPPPRETSVRTPSPVPTQVVRRESPRQEIRIAPPPALITRTTTPPAPQPAPRVQRVAPAPLPARESRAALMPVTAPQALRIENRSVPTVPIAPRGTATPAGTLAGNPPINGERPTGGRGGNLATRGN